MELQAVTSRVDGLIFAICCRDESGLQPEKSCAGKTYVIRGACFSENNVELSV